MTQLYKSQTHNTNNSATPYNFNGVVFEGERLEMSYEELCDIFAHYRDSGNGYMLTRQKCGDVFGNLLYDSNY